MDSLFNLSNLVLYQSHAMEGGSKPPAARRTSMSDGRPDLRRVSATAAMPATRHVGFRVEGVPPSPAQAILAGARETANTAAGSPTPVIIPPSFQVRVVPHTASAVHIPAGVDMHGPRHGASATCDHRSCPGVRCCRQPMPAGYFELPPFLPGQAHRWTPFSPSRGHLELR